MALFRCSNHSLAYACRDRRHAIYSLKWSVVIASLLAQGCEPQSRPSKPPPPPAPPSQERTVIPAEAPPTETEPTKEERIVAVPAGKTALQSIRDASAWMAAFPEEHLQFDAATEAGFGHEVAGSESACSAFGAGPARPPQLQAPANQDAVLPFPSNALGPSSRSPASRSFGQSTSPVS